MNNVFGQILRSVRTGLTKHPTPEDALSVINSTAVATIVTALNALIYTLGAYDSGSANFLLIWLACTFALSALLAVKSHRASRYRPRRVSRRTARKLIVTSAALALPWAVLPVYVFALHGNGEPMIVLIITTGMLSGGAFVLHRAYVAALFYMWTILLFFTVSMHVGGWPQAWAATAYALIYGLFLAYFAYQAGETARQKDQSVEALSNAVESLRRARDENYLLANIDDTTGLLNRKSFHEHLEAAVARQQAQGTGFTLLLMDLDRFKNVNDLFSHNVGDELLAEVAKRLRRYLPETVIIGRLGGDEFSVILANVVRPQTIEGIAARLLEKMREPAFLAGRHVHTGLSIGAVVCPDDASGPMELMQKADLALNRAKETGRGQCVKFDGTLHDQVVSHDAIEVQLREALADGLIHMEYQPKYALSDGQLIGAEALVRMRSPSGAAVTPDQFLPIAAERGLLPHLSRYIANAVAKDILSWRNSNLSPGKIALNIHPEDVKSPELLMTMIETFETRGITGDDLVLEITEGCFVGRGTDRSIMVLDALADRGYDLSLDDFGTGHASLTHLKSIPVSEIKIDRSFIAGLVHKRDDRAIVAAIVEIARGMGIRSIAEGVENIEQHRILADLGVDGGQGFLWSPAMSAQSFAAQMARTAEKTA